MFTHFRLRPSFGVTGIAICPLCSVSLSLTKQCFTVRIRYDLFFTHLCMDVWVAPGFWLLYVKLLAALDVRARWTHAFISVE